MGWKMLIDVISGLLKIFCCILYLKCFMRKTKKLCNFYFVVEEMNMTKIIKNTKLLVTLLVVFDFSVPAYFVLFWKMHICYLVIFLLFQSWYLIEMLTKKEKKSDRNCGCYVINLPQKVSFSSVLTNLSVSYLFIMIFLWDNI